MVDIRTPVRAAVRAPVRIGSVVDDTDEDEDVARPVLLTTSPSVEDNASGLVEQPQVRARTVPIEAASKVRSAPRAVTVLIEEMLADVNVEESGLYNPHERTLRVRRIDASRSGLPLL